MEHLNKKEEICRKVAENFQFAGKITKMSPYGSGHINDTFMLTCELEDGSNKHYILQRMNDDIFRNPKELMENVVNVTMFLRKKIIAAGGDPERETLNIILTKDGANYLQDETGDYWRSYVFIDDATCFDLVEKPEDFYNSAVAFGHFQQLLADYYIGIRGAWLKEYGRPFSQLLKSSRGRRSRTCKGRAGRDRICQSERGRLSYHLRCAGKRRDPAACYPQ